jgi:hypothetical protein
VGSDTRTVLAASASHSDSPHLSKPSGGSSRRTRSLESSCGTSSACEAASNRRLRAALEARHGDGPIREPCPRSQALVRRWRTLVVSAFRAERPRSNDVANSSCLAAVPAFWVPGFGAPGVDQSSRPTPVPRTAHRPPCVAFPGGVLSGSSSTPFFSSCDVSSIPASPRCGNGCGLPFFSRGDRSRTRGRRRRRTDTPQVGGVDGGVRKSTSKSSPSRG